MLRKKEREKKHSRKIASRAEAIWGWATAAGQVRARRRAELLIACASITKGDEVLEIGAGTGVFTQKISETGAHITAIDISIELLEKAIRKVRNVNFCVADVENMPFGASTFDAVVGSSILHHLDIIPALREINKVLKDCGRISLAEPNMMNPQIMLQKNILLKIAKIKFRLMRRRIGISKGSTSVTMLIKSECLNWQGVALR